jgi:hypothetical protein
MAASRNKLPSPPGEKRPRSAQRIRDTPPIAPPIKARKASAAKDQSENNAPHPPDDESPRTQPLPDHYLKTTPRKFGKGRILKNDCIVNIILSNELRANAPPETMF